MAPNCRGRKCLCKTLNLTKPNFWDKIFMNYSINFMIEIHQMKRDCHQTSHHTYGGFMPIKLAN